MFKKTSSQGNSWEQVKLFVQQQPRMVLDELRTQGPWLTVLPYSRDDYSVYYGENDNTVGMKIVTPVGVPQLGVGSPLTDFEVMALAKHPLFPNVFLVRETSNPALFSVQGWQNVTQPVVSYHTDEELIGLISDDEDAIGTPETLIKVFYSVVFCKPSPSRDRALALTTAISVDTNFHPDYRETALACLEAIGEWA